MRVADSPAQKTKKHLVADTVFALSCGYLGLSMLGGSLWPPYDIALAVVFVGAAYWLGDFRHRWWPIVSQRDRDHERHID